MLTTLAMLATTVVSCDAN